MFVGGALGTLARAGLLAALPATTGWPWATWIVNLAGTAVLAATPKRHLRLVGTGFCGALTTFSTFQLEVLRMLDRGDALQAAAYVGSSVAAGLTLAHLVSRRRTWA